MKVIDKGEVIIPPRMRKKHGLLPQANVDFVDLPDGVLVTRARKPSRGRNVLATLLGGGVVKARTKEWLQLTRGDA